MMMKRSSYVQTRSMLGFLLMVFALLSTNVFANVTNQQAVLQSLIQKARQEVQQSVQEDDQRLAEFKRLQNDRKKMLEQAQQRLKQLESKAQELDKRYTDNREVIRDKSVQLLQERQQYNQLFSVIRHHGQDLDQTVKNSLLAATKPDWLSPLEVLHQSDIILTEKEVRQVWSAYLNWLVLSGNVQHHQEYAVIYPDGEERRQAVTLLGPFNAVSEGQWLRYLSDSQRFMVMLPQPGYVTFEQKILAKDENGLTGVLMDHRNGSLMKQLIAQQSWKDHIKAGGIIGLIIILLGVMGVLIVVIRMIQLRRYRLHNHKKFPQEQQLLREQLAGLDAELVEVSLMELLQQKLLGLNRGMSLIATIATIAPLLGLLGTVVGMIDTFQMLMQYGNGDPKVLSEGISKALVTTELGLVVAVPLILCHSQLGSLIQKLQQWYERHYARMNVELLQDKQSAAS